MRVRFALMLAVAGCASTPASKPAPTPAVAETSPTPDVQGFVVRGLLGAARPVAPLAELPTRVQAPDFEGSKGDVRSVYRKVAPATVLVRSGTGFGTGVLINAQGYVLTNHHVVADAQLVDFRRRVTVEFGRLNASGAMELSGEPRDAWVLKSDPLVDLAVLKVDRLPKGVAPVKVSKRDPLPGEPVAALGNGGVGLLWAIKDGEVASIGRLSTHLAQLVARRCDVPTSSGADARALCREVNASADAQREYIEARVPALVIQSTCTISPGDSGGPLVNRAGDLVGLNAFLRSDGSTSVTSNFHVHVTELRRFLKTVPAEAVAELPEPDEYLDGCRWFDLDADGVAESCLTGLAARVRLTGEHGAGPGDFVVALTEDGFTAWADGDGDGRFDDLAMELSDGLHRWRIDGRGRVAQVPEPGRLISASPFGGERAARLRPVLERLAQARPTAEDGDRPPREVVPVLGPLQPGDADGDGHIDAVKVITLFGARLVLDPTQRVIAGSTPETLREALEAGTPLTTLSLVKVEDRNWVLLGPADSRVALLRDRLPSVISAGYSMGGAEGGAERPEYFGASYERVLALAHMGAERAWVRNAVAGDVSRAAGDLRGGPFIDPVRDLSGDVSVESSGVPGLEWAVASLDTGRVGLTALLYELDADALRGVSVDARKRAVEAHGPGTDLAIVQWGDWRWFLYDTDADGAFDIVFVHHAGVLAARRVSKDGRVTADDALVKGGPFRPDLFPDGRAAALRRLANAAVGRSDDAP